MNTVRTLAGLAPIVLAGAFVTGCSHDAPPDAANAAPLPATTVSESTHTVTTTQTTTSPALGIAADAAVSTASDGTVAIDGPAPSFDPTDQNGEHLQLEALRGHNVVLYFYPKDETPGCTKEACSFRDSWTSLTKSGVILIGVSADSDESHKAFAKNHQLPFHLVSDPQGKLAARYGVPFNGNYIQRQSFLIGPAGTVRRVYRTVDVSSHAQDLISVVQG